MITINKLLEQIIRRTPFLEEGLSQGIINLSALSRKIKPQIEKELLKPVSESAILMALKRLLPDIMSKSETMDINLKAGDITVRSGLTEFTYLKSATLIENKMQLLDEIKSSGDFFVTITQGVHETTMIVNSSLEKRLEEIFRGETLVKKIDDLAAITIRLTGEMVYLPGVHYNILKQLAWHNINIIEVVSTYTEFNIILQKKEVDTSFSILLKYLSP
ncbi:MAG: aspartate kinase [Calditrichae bacterium]|nr:aspartate kinase [Calditrichia bacterium]